MTRKRSTTAIRQDFTPDDNLVRAEAVLLGVPPEGFTGALLAFGQIPEQGQRDLLRHVCVALNRYRFLKKTETPLAVRVTPSEERNRLQLIEKHARKLLRLFGVKCRVMPPRWLLDDSPTHTPWQRLSILQSLSIDGRPIDPNAKSEAVVAATTDATAGAVLLRLAHAGIDDEDDDDETVHRVNKELAAPSNRTAETVISLLWLHSQAELAERSVPKQGRGGARNRPTPKGTIIRDALDIYAHMRKQYPDIGSKPGWGEPMLKFIRAIVMLAGPSVTDTEIWEVWRARDSSRK